MSSSHYERVPQLDDNIYLESIPADSSYNYNTAVPTSPPPSFRSRTSSTVSPETTSFSNVLLTPETTEHASSGGVNSLASSVTVGGNEELILNLNKRIERLEESIGRLLVEKEKAEGGKPDQARSRDNCCVTFYESENSTGWSDAEMANSTGNCCVTFRGRRTPQSSEERACKIAIRLFVFTFAMVIVWTTLLAFAHRKNN